MLIELQKGYLSKSFLNIITIPQIIYKKTFNYELGVWTIVSKNVIS